MRDEYSTVNKKGTSDLFLVPLEIVGSQVFTAFIVVPLVSMRKGTEETCVVLGTVREAAARTQAARPGTCRHRGGRQARTR